MTVTKNIFYGAIWDFNVHIWDSSDTTSPFTLISDADLEPTMFFQAYPWRLCARTLGSTLDWKVWPTYKSRAGLGRTRTMAAPRRSRTAGKTPVSTASRAT